MNYIGSKLSLLKFIEESILSVVSDKDLTFCDLFAGTGVVGSHFKSLGFRTYANDLQYYSFTLNKHWLENNKELKFANLQKELPSIEFSENPKLEVLNYLQNLDGINGFVFNNYCPSGENNKEFQRQYFSNENGKKADAIRTKIEDWKNDNLIKEGEYFFLIACLLEAIDKVANTASVYGAFLKKIKKSAQKTLSLQPLRIIESDKENQVFNQNATELAKSLDADIVYMDPPYNQRQYATNYHLLETIAKYDNPEIYGKTGLREYSHQKSEFCSKRTIMEAMCGLVQDLNAKYIFLSYNNEGLISCDDIEKLFKEFGEYKCFTKKYSRFKADKDHKRNYKADETIEYLHCLIRR